MEFIGNTEIKRQIAIAAASAKNRNMALPHMLFSGAAGCGKTTLAKVIAGWCGTEFVSVLPQSLKNMEDILDLFKKLNHDNYDKRGDRIGIVKPAIIFIDEVHNLALQPQEWLGVAMEGFEIESGDSGKLVWFPYFTLVGATTDDGKLSKPFRDRFKLRFVFKPYSSIEAAKIVLSHAKRLDIRIDIPAAQEIAKRGRGIPRILVGYLERTRDMACVCKKEAITMDVVGETFKGLGVDDIGLTETEIKILKTLYNAKEPIGAENLAIITNESQKTLIASIEPFLIMKGFIVRSGKGRRITELGRKYWEKTRGYSEGIEKVELEAGYIRK